MISDRTLIEGQINKFNTRDQKLLKNRQWPEIFNQKIDLKKINIQSMKPWIEKKIGEYIGVEDEITSLLLISELESYPQYPCAKELSIIMTGFLGHQTQDFMTEFWELLLEAQKSHNGIPQSIISERKEEILLKQQTIMNQVNQLENLRQIFSDGAHLQQQKRSRSRDKKRKYSFQSDNQRSEDKKREDKKRKDSKKESKQDKHIKKHKKDHKKDKKDHKNDKKKHKIDKKRDQSNDQSSRSSSIY